MITPTRRLTATLLCAVCATGLNGAFLTTPVQAADEPATNQILTLEEWLKQNTPKTRPAEKQPEKPPAAAIQPVKVPQKVRTAAHQQKAAESAPILPVGFETTASTPTPTPRSTPASTPTPANSSVQNSAAVESTVGRLLNAARMALATDDVRKAHLLAEAAAEMQIPFRLFERNAGQVLDEIEYVTSQRSGIVRTAYAQQAPTAPAQPATPAAQPAPYTETKPNGASDVATSDGREFRAIRVNSLSVRPVRQDTDGNKLVLPEQRARQAFRRNGEVAHTMGFSRDWTALSYAWDAPVVRHQPLYFEDTELERYGNEYAVVQPFVSAGRFYGTFATLPYQMSLPDNAWFHSVHDLGHDRPGNCVPYSIHTLPLDPTAGLSASGVFTALVFMLMTP